MYAFRIMRLPLLDAGGAAIGRLDDVATRLVARMQGDRAHEAVERALGFIAHISRPRQLQATIAQQLNGFGQMLVFSTTTENFITDDDHANHV